MKRSPLIDIRDVEVSFSGRKALKGITWQLREGEHWAVLGPNGAGKSTFLRLIRGDIWPDVTSAGKRTYHFGRNAEESPVDIRQKIAFVSPERQDAYARNNWDLIGIEVILTGFSDSAYLHREAKKSEREYADRIVRALKLEDLRHRSLLSMSEGEARKVLIARALVSRPRVLVLDEFCSGLDVSAREQMLGLIERIARKGTQVVYTTHRLEELVPSISHVVFFSSGKIAKQGEIGHMLDGEDSSRMIGNNFRSSRSVLSEEDMFCSGVDINNQFMTSLTSFPQTKRACLPAGRSGILLFRKDSGQAGMMDFGIASGRFNRGNSSYFLRIKNADVCLEGKKVLEEINWQIKADENWAVLGKNGAGKTTLLKLIRGDLHPAFGGEVLRFGEGRQTDLWEFRKRTGYISSELQAGYDYPLTGREVVQSGFFSSIGLYRRVSSEQKAAAGRWVQFFGLEGVAGREVGSISYGEMRKILLARAMVNNPEMLILDEPCSGLDISARRDFLNTLERLTQAGIRIVLVTHHAEDLIPSITHVLLMDAGRIAARGRKRDVLPAVTKLLSRQGLSQARRRV